MFRVSRLIAVMAVVGAIWFFWPFGKYEEVVPIAPQADTEQGQLFTKPLSGDAAAPQANTNSDSSTQDDTGANRDLAAAPPDGANQQATQKALLRPKRFYRVVVLDGGNLQAGGTAIALAEIEVEGLTGQCEDSRGQAWPCGRAARSALMRLIRGRAVVCHVPASNAPEILTARCSVGGKDLSFWMVAQGWAKPAQPAQAAFKEAQDAARERRLGIWR
ncbi:MAG: thermonuclease family protein [Methyloceanibacter sp.]|nr:thermonuclease family protein [Methyloceanibacter sp.]